MEVDHASGPREAGDTREVNRAKREAYLTRHMQFNVRRVAFSLRLEPYDKTGEA
jgi:hypothetical protein